MNKTHAIASGPRDGLKELLPFQPTTDRDFLRDDVVKMFMRFYQGGKSKIAPVSVAIKITSSEDKAVFENTESVDIAKFGANRASDYLWMLPIDKLAPGPYLVTFTATMGKDTVRRDVRFEVH